MAVCVCASTSAASKDAPKKDTVQLGSTSLCGDAYLRVLAPDNIAALSWQSRDALSLASADERALPQIWDDPEILLAAGLDKVIYGPGEGSRSASFISGSTHVKWGESFDAVKDNYARLGTVLGVDNQHLNRDLEQRLAALKKPARKPKILYLNRSGLSAGSGSYVDAVIRAAGGENLITAPGWPSLDPEIILALEPDLILTSYFEDGYESVNARPVRHKALQNFLAAHERLEIPGALWPCAGPHMIDAAEILNAKIWDMP